jgi:hypothetical protein
VDEVEGISRQEAKRRPHRAGLVKRSLQRKPREGAAHEAECHGDWAKGNRDDPLAGRGQGFVRCRGAAGEVDQGDSMALTEPPYLVQGAELVAF